MNILRLAFELFVIYIVYKFVFDFIIPVYKTTRQMQQKMNDMQQRMQQNQQQQAQNRNHNSGQPAATPTQPMQGDYIDYEEVK